MSKLLIRFDDICPTMDWVKFAAFEELIDSLQLAPIIGVIPHNEDGKLKIGAHRSDFWNWVRTKKDLGWTVAQHGSKHLYRTNDSGILNRSNKSEFAGRSYFEQFSDLEFGKEILIQEKVWEPVFMAPSHSFDDTTLQALVDLGFMYVTDGDGYYPYIYKGVKFIPQMYVPKKFSPLGLYTVCIHVNTMSIKEAQRTLTYIAANRDRIIGFKEASSMNDPSIGPALRKVSRSLIGGLNKFGLA